MPTTGYINTTSYTGMHCVICDSPLDEDYFDTCSICRRAITDALLQDKLELSYSVIPKTTSGGRVEPKRGAE